MTSSSIKTNLHSDKKRVIEILYLIACFFVYLFWASKFVMPEYGPDEYMRILVPEYIAENKTIPNGWEPSLTNPIWGFSYAFQIKLPYLLAGLFIYIVSQFTANATAILLAARMVNIMFMVGAVYYAMKLTNRITTSPIRWIFIIFVSLTPQFIFFGSYYNLEAYTIFTVLMILDSWIVGIQQEWNKKSCIYIGVSLALCILGYEFAYSYILCSAVLFILWHIKHRANSSFKQFISKVGIIVLVFSIICGWYLVRNFILYDGDIFAVKIQGIMSEQNAVDYLRPSVRPTPKNLGQSIIDMLRETEWFLNTMRSTFCILGYMVITLPLYVYRVYFSILIIGSALFILLGYKSNNPKDFSILMLSISAAAIITFCISIYYSWARDYQAQGRYIIYSMLPIYMLTAAGFDCFFNRICNVIHINATVVKRIVVILFLIAVLATDCVAYNACVEYLT